MEGLSVEVLMVRAGDAILRSLVCEVWDWMCEKNDRLLFCHLKWRGFSWRFEKKALALLICMASRRSVQKNKGNGSDASDPLVFLCSVYNALIKQALHC